MNYWLDLNHVASEGARKAAVNTFATYGEYDTYIREPAGDRRAAHRRHVVDSGRGHGRDLLARGIGRRRPGEGAGRRRLQPALHRHGDHAPRHRHDAARAGGPAGHHRRGVRMSAARGFADLAAREDGGIVVFVALLIPVVLLFLSLTVDIGNWWVHKRHLQLQVDAAAFAGGALLGGCFSDSGAANTAIKNEATRFGGGAGSSYNGQVGGAIKGAITLLYQSPSYANGTVDSGPHRDAGPVRHAEPDVRREGDRSRPAAHLPDSGPAQRRRDQRARARAAEAGRGAGRDAARRRARPPFHVRVRDLRQRGHAAHPSGRWSCRRPARAATTSSGRLRRRSPSRSPRRMSASGSVSSAAPIRTPPAAQLYTECYDLGSTDGVVHIRGWSTGDRADRSQRLAAARHLPAGRVLREERLQRRDPGRGRPRRDSSFDRHRCDREGVGGGRRQRSRTS